MENSHLSEELYQAIKSRLENDPGFCVHEYVMNAWDGYAFEDIPLGGLKAFCQKCGHTRKDPRTKTINPGGNS